MVDYKNCLHINQMEKILDSVFAANAKIYAYLREASLIRTEEIRKIVATETV